jgi:glutamine synthetase
MGASPTWSVFCPDSQIAFTPSLNVVGDWRLHAIPSMNRPLDNSVIWTPTTMTSQDGQVSPFCPRSLLANLENKAQELGYNTLFGCEFEFYLLDDDHKDCLDSGPIKAMPWDAYGAESFLQREDFFIELQRRCAQAQIPLEQMHCEYDKCQMEISTAPSSATQAADLAVLTKLIIKSVARQFGMAASFSPKPFVDLSGNGGHIHFSMTHNCDATPVFSTGEGAYGLTPEGEYAIAGIQEHVCELTAIYAGSPVSQLRLSPDSWSGATACWGLENKEASIRLCTATKGNPLGANVELKCADLAASPYYAIACILGSALDGIVGELPLAKGASVNPMLLSAAEREKCHARALPTSYDRVTDAFRSSHFAAELLGQEVVDAELAIRELMSKTYSGAKPEEIAHAMRFVW